MNGTTTWQRGSHGSVKDGKANGALPPVSSRSDAYGMNGGDASTVVTTDTSKDPDVSVAPLGEAGVSSAETSGQAAHEMLLTKARIVQKEETTYLLPRVAIFAADGVSADVVRTMADSVAAILPGAIVLPQRSLV